MGDQVLQQAAKILFIKKTIENGFNCRESLLCFLKIGTIDSRQKCNLSSLFQAFVVSVANGEGLGKAAKKSS